MNITENAEYTEKFLADLTELCKKYDIWIQGNPCPRCNLSPITPRLSGKVCATDLDSDSGWYSALFQVYLTSKKERESNGIH